MGLGLPCSFYFRYTEFSVPNDALCSSTNKRGKWKVIALSNKIRANYVYLVESEFTGSQVWACWFGWTRQRRVHSGIMEGDCHNFYLVEFEFAGSQVNLLVWLNWTRQRRFLLSFREVFRYFDPYCFVMQKWKPSQLDPVSYKLYRLVLGLTLEVHKIARLLGCMRIRR